jgi:hypothetical protein
LQTNEPVDGSNHERPAEDITNRYRNEIADEKNAQQDRLRGPDGVPTNRA